MIDDGFLRRYRELLDAEDAAFDELEHAVEEGDRAHYELDLESWKSTVAKRMAFLERQGFTPISAGARPRVPTRIVRRQGAARCTAGQLADDIACEDHEPFGAADEVVRCTTHDRDRRVRPVRHFGLDLSRGTDFVPLGQHEPLGPRIERHDVRVAEVPQGPAMASHAVRRGSWTDSATSAPNDQPAMTSVVPDGIFASRASVAARASRRSPSPSP